MKIIPFLALFLLLITRPALAQTDYSIDGGVVPNTSFSQEDQPVKAPQQTGIHGQFSGQNYKIQVGFEDSNRETPITTTFSQTEIEYGQLLPTDPVARIANVSVNEPYSQGYTMQVFEDHPLKQVDSSSIIPDTTCDNGLCSDTVATSWQAPLTYGFGYRCDQAQTNASNYCLSDFNDSTSFMQFSKEVAPAVLMQGDKDSAAQLTFRLNISGTQASQFYQNQITFITVPNF